MPPFGGQAGASARSWLRLRGGLGHVSQTRPVLKDRLAPAFACEAQISFLEPSLSDFVRCDRELRIDPAIASASRAAALTVLPGPEPWTRCERGTCPLPYAGR